IIPENLVDEPTITTDTTTGKPTAISNPRYAKLHQLMSTGYAETYQGGNYEHEGSFQGSEVKTTKLRIILTKDIQNLADDLLFKETINKSIEDLEADPRFKHYTGLSELSYLIYQRDYFKRTGKHVDDKGWTWLPESTWQLSGRVSYAVWVPGVGQLYFGSNARGYRGGVLGCRLAGSFEINI
ncbi:MAG: hypothetical protein HY981_01455, partial [Candidatus Magasanikbacteria bacterium]|nr:hypothetical protein [Candidatus Magasanikbacteria bacterium]